MLVNEKENIENNNSFGVSEKTAKLIYSTETTELISKRPDFFIRKGVSLILLFLLLLLIASWFIQYPDKIETHGVLKSINAPKEIITKTNGKLIWLGVKENQNVSQNEIIGYMESTANPLQIINLSSTLDSIAGDLMNGKSEKLTHYLPMHFDNLGELQSAYQIFSNSFSQFTNYLNTGYYIKKKAMLLADITYLKRLSSTLDEQKKLMQEDITLMDSTVEAQKSLRDFKAISAMDYRNEKSKLIAKQITLPQINASIISNESQQHEKQKEIAELENLIQQQKSLFAQTLNTIRSEVEKWKKEYLLISPISGKVTFVTFLQENQELNKSQLVCLINPGNSNFYIETLIPQYNFGKVSIGQEVLLKFSAYPYQEFGSVTGKIEFINMIPADSGYLAKISLSDGLTTNYKKTIPYRTGLSVQADIITNKKRLLQRLIDNFKGSFSK